ncbi:hypothetical protein [Paracoccus sp. MC1862]|uniref:hypothetical protein n=1 Tax=Paracoccus sp. MC1862 TaxID=2760307 RepID=UPI0016001670|nr:hypothetical protein [Paracoccus sp. MC1862]MBB1499605.1 hypothetical protein [Paracoccus sp. MC1862]QQO44991.1 hypothetical protein JGR78_00775 [Paracoccus sp. MC1862]
MGLTEPETSEHQGSGEAVATSEMPIHRKPPFARRDELRLRSPYLLFRLGAARVETVEVRRGESGPYQTFGLLGSTLQSVHSCLPPCRSETYGKVAESTRASSGYPVERSVRLTQIVAKLKLSSAGPCPAASLAILGRRA